jgi:uncharacterized protein (DUF433 family)
MKKRKVLGKCVVVDPDICHGKPTFLGTRIMVWQITESVAAGRKPSAISRDWGGRISLEAIAEAVKLFPNGLGRGEKV